MKRTHLRLTGCAVVMAAAVVVGCQTTPSSSDHATMSRGSTDQDALARGQSQSSGVTPTEASGVADCPPSYEEALTGGKVFNMYCAACHNARALGERPFASYQNAATHMRVRCNLTGEEYRKLMDFLRYWHDIPPQTPAVEPSPKRLIFSQPISELRREPTQTPEIRD